MESSTLGESTVIPTEGASVSKGGDNIARHKSSHHPQVGLSIKRLYEKDWHSPTSYCRSGISQACKPTIKF